VEDLKQAIDKNIWEQKHEDQYQELDSIITESMLYAERQSGKSFSKNYEWSPKLKQAVHAVRYWKLRIQQKQGKVISRTRIDHYRNEASIKEDNASTIQQIIEAIKASSKDLKEHQRNHKNLRTSYLEELAEAIVLSTSPSVKEDISGTLMREKCQLQLRKLLRREQKRQLYRKLGFLLHRKQNQGLGKVDVPDRTAQSPTTGNPDDPKTWTGPWKTITNPDELAKIIKEINRQQYHQAHGTPFGSGPLAEQIGRRGDTEIAMDLIHGKLPPHVDNQMPETQ
jgi:hypothetical protein